MDASAAAADRPADNDEQLRLLRGIAIFVAGYAAFDALPVILAGDDVLKQLNPGDLIDFPLVFLLVGLYIYLGFQAELWRDTRFRVAGVVLLVLLVQGHGVHLAANAISDDVAPTSKGKISAYFLDEHVGHSELHTAIILLALLFVLAGTARPTALATRQTLVWLAPLALVHGLFLAADAVEGQTVPLMIPAGVVIGGVGFGLRRDASVYRAFFSSAFAVAVVTLAVYGIAYQGYPEIDFIPFLN